MDKAVGAAFHRLQAAQKQERCSASKLEAIMNDYRRAVDAMASDVLLEVRNGQLQCRTDSRQVIFDPPIRVWSETDLASTLSEHAKATTELIAAERGWQRVTGQRAPSSN